MPNQNLIDSLSSLLSFLFYVLIAFPVCLVSHEVGHAVMALLLTRQKVTFQFGAKGGRHEIHWGRLTVVLYLEASTMLGARYFMEDYPALSMNQVVWITLGGPLASLLLTIVCSIFWYITQSIDPWRGLTIINLISFLNTSIPRHYDAWQGVQGGIPNDALQIVQLFQQAKDKAGVSRS